MPIAIAAFQRRPADQPTAAISATLMTTCSPPSPTSRWRMSQRTRGRISSPIRNSISTTPYSAKACTLSASRPTSPSAGPIATPAPR